MGESNVQERLLLRPEEVARSLAIGRTAVFALSGRVSCGR